MPGSSGELQIKSPSKTSYFLHKGQLRSTSYSISLDSMEENNRRRDATFRLNISVRSSTSRYCRCFPVLFVYCRSLPPPFFRTLLLERPVISYHDSPCGQTTTCLKIICLVCLLPPFHGDCGMEFGISGSASTFVDAVNKICNKS